MSASRANRVRQNIHVALLTKDHLDRAGTDVSPTLAASRLRYLTLGDCHRRLVTSTPQKSSVANTHLRLQTRHVRPQPMSRGEGGAGWWRNGGDDLFDLMGSDDRREWPPRASTFPTTGGNATRDPHGEIAPAFPVSPSGATDESRGVENHQSKKKGVFDCNSGAARGIIPFRSKLLVFDSSFYFSSEVDPWFVGREALRSLSCSS